MAVEYCAESVQRIITQSAVAVFFDNLYAIINQYKRST
jgi:hypothetical protein